VAELSAADRRAAIIHLERLRREVADASTWLSLHGADRAGIRLECAESDLAASCWDLEKPARASRPDCWLSDGQAAPRPYHI
jgi:hypothetical protein